MEEFFSNKYGGGVKLGVLGAEPDQARTADEGTETKEAPLDLQFDYLPRDIKKYLDRFVVKQDAAKKVLATTICDHYNHIKRCSAKGPCKEYSKQNIIMLGPTGVGKTYLVRTIADLIGVPFVKADATKFSETGYVGGDVEDLVRELVHKADGNVRLAEYGIIYLDEIDKISTPTNILGRDVSGGGVQRGLLKLMEETEVSLRTPFDLTSQLQAAMEFQSKGKVNRSVINTRHILFIVSGAFTGLADIIRRRLGAKAIGFSSTGRSVPRDEDYFQFAKSNDFIEYGFESEFVGRLPVVVSCHELGIDDLFQILKQFRRIHYSPVCECIRSLRHRLDRNRSRAVPDRAESIRRSHGRAKPGGCLRTHISRIQIQPATLRSKAPRTDGKAGGQPDEVLGEILEVAKVHQLNDMAVAFIPSRMNGPNTMESRSTSSRRRPAC